MREPPRRGTVTSVTCPFTLTRQLNSLAGPGITSNVTPEYSLLDARREREREREREESHDTHGRSSWDPEERCYLFSLYMAIVRTVFRWSSIWNTSAIGSISITIDGRVWRSRDVKWESTPNRGNDCPTSSEIEFKQASTIWISFRNQR